jgi:hypothetical protein
MSQVSSLRRSRVSLARVGGAGVAAARLASRTRFVTDGAFAVRTHGQRYRDYASRVG